MEDYAMSLIVALVGGGAWGGIGWAYAKRQGEVRDLTKMLTTVITAIAIVLIARFMNIDFNAAQQFFLALGGAAMVSKLVSWIKFEIGYKNGSVPEPPKDKP